MGLAGIGAESLTREDLYMGRQRQEVVPARDRTGDLPRVKRT